MWANAQRDGRPAKHMWRPLFNAAKFGCCAVTLPRCETCWNFAGVPQTTGSISATSGPSLPYYEYMWRTYCCSTSFFPIVDKCLSCEDIARQSCAMVPRWRFLATFLQHISDLHLKFTLRPHHVCKYGRHEIGRGIKEERRRRTRTNDRMKI